ncbi:hypothetical protein V1477_002673 [Vespula maculifrons]|uniref:Secreted protein n=1 Tax=Vespula maculifrons TaxID=7453 RepID=A0ABD2CVA7_VESMC
MHRIIVLITFFCSFRTPFWIALKCNYAYLRSRAGNNISWCKLPQQKLAQNPFKGLNRDDESAYAAFCGLFGGGAKAGTGPTSG